MTFCQRTAQRAIALLLPATFILLISAATSGHAFEKLTEAQTWIYDHHHLSNTSNGQVIKYKFTSTDNDLPPVHDVATLSIINTGDDDKRDVEVDFLSDERRIPLPPFNGFKGNPMVIAMLEHIAQTMGRETGGGVLYFRNRIRDALASKAVKLENAERKFNDQTVTTTTLTFQPFTSDTYLTSHPIFKQSEFTIEFSDDVPAGLIAVGVIAETDGERFERQLIIQ